MRIRSIECGSIRNIALGLMLCLNSCANPHGDEGAQAEVKPVVPVRATVVTRGAVEEILSVTGRTEAIRMEKLTAPIAGRITKLSALEGANVKEGDVLAVIITKDAQASIEGARVLLAQATTEDAKVKAQEVLRQVEATANGVTVRTSLTGVVSLRSANEGEFVQEGQDLFTIIDPQTVQFVAEVPLASMSAVRTGESARVWLPGAGETKLSASVQSVKPQADRESQSAKVVLHFGQIPRRFVQLLRTDIIGTAEIVSGSHTNSLLVPSDALLRNDENNEYNIVTFGADSLARIVPVEKGSESGNKVEVRNLPDAPNAIKEGMSVITEGNYALPDSTRITLLH